MADLMYAPWRVKNEVLLSNLEGVWLPSCGFTGDAADTCPKQAIGIFG
jgi:hypothetical protein